MIVTVTKFETCPANSQYSHVVGYRVEHGSADPSGMGFPLYQEFDSYIPHSLVTETISDKEIVKVGLELITSKIDDFAHGTQCNIGSSFTKPIIGETFQYPLAKGDDRETPSIENVVSLLGKVSSDGLKPYTTPLLNKDERHALILKAAGSGLVTPVDGSDSWFSYSDKTYRLKCHIKEGEYSSIFVQARVKDSAFVILVDTATNTLNIMVPNQVVATIRAFESGLTPLETDFITTVIKHMRIFYVNLFYTIPKNAEDVEEHRFQVALESFMERTKNNLVGGITYRDIDVWSDMIDKYFTEMDRM
jgi:hypothetical protein